MRLLALAFLAFFAVPAVATADPYISIFHPGGGILLAELDDGGGALAKLVGSSKQNPVRCYKATDGVIGILGAAGDPIAGCFVGIARDGTLVPPPASKKWSLAHMLPSLDVTPGFAKRPDGSIEVTLSGGGGNAVGLWVDCYNVKGPMTCVESNGMLGKFNWTIAFVVGKGGVVRAPKP